MELDAELCKILAMIMLQKICVP